MRNLKVSTTKKEDIVDITDEVMGLAKYNSGICFIFLKHNAAGLCIHESESKLRHSTLKRLNSISRESNKKIDNSIKSNLLNNSVLVPIQDGHLMLGDLQKIFLVDFDGPRELELIIHIK